MIDPADMASIMARVSEALARIEAGVAGAIGNLDARLTALEARVAADQGTLNRPAEPDGPTVFVRAKPNAPPNNGDQP